MDVTAFNASRHVKLGKEVVAGAKIVLQHCSPDVTPIEDHSLVPLPVESADKTFSSQHLSVFYDQTTTEFFQRSKTNNWTGRLFNTAIREFINDIFTYPEVKRLPGVMVAPQSAYSKENINSKLTVGKISRWAHLLDTCFNSAAQVKYHALADRPADVGGKPTVKAAFLQCISALLHDAAVYVFSHTGEDALVAKGIPADHDAILLLLIRKFAKAGLFNKFHLSEEEVMGATFPPEFADAFVKTRDPKELSQLRDTLHYWKDAVGGVDEHDITSILQTSPSSQLYRCVEQYRGVARYVHNCLDNVSYIPTDQGHASRAEMIALKACENGSFVLPRAAACLSQQQIAELPGAIRTRIHAERDYYLVRKEIDFGSYKQPVDFLVELRRRDRLDVPPLAIPIYLREIREPQHSYKWKNVKVGKTLLSKDECLRSTWASIDGDVDLVTSSTSSIYRIIKGQFDYARRKVSGETAALSGGFFRMILNQVDDAVSPHDFVRKTDEEFIRAYYPKKFQEFFVPKKAGGLPRGYNTYVTSLLSFTPKTDIDWYQQRVCPQDFKKWIEGLRDIVKGWAAEHGIEYSNEFYVGSAPTISKTFNIRACHADSSDPFHFLKERGVHALETFPDGLYLKQFGREDDTFSSRLRVNHGALEHGTQDLIFNMDEHLPGAVVVCYPKSFVDPKRKEYNLHSTYLKLLKERLISYVRLTKVAWIEKETLERGERTVAATNRPVLDFYKMK